MDARCIFLIFLIPLIGVTRCENDVENNENSETGGRELRDWPWGRKHKFTCPSLFGTFADILDCSAFYVCVGGVANRMACKRRMQFDKYRKVCLPFIIAVCDKGDDDDQTTNRPTTKDGGRETTKGKFTCSGLLGSGKYEYPDDCSKYYSCTFYISSIKTCPEGELFDGGKKECKPAKDVDCGTRQRPSDATTEEITTTQIVTETPTPTKPETTPTEPESTTTPTEPETTTEPEPTTTTTKEPTTTKRPRVTAPDTDCDEDDVDCIIDDLGETPDWFVCPEDIGSYPHPSSKKLFIFCLNWKPSVKKCGQDLVFSEDLMTCTHPYYK